MNPGPADSLAALISDWRVGWSLGLRGAIAEFHRSENERQSRISALTIATDRGGLDVQWQPGARLFAHEALGHDGNGWTQSIELCLPEGEAALAGLAVVTCIGPDASALQPAVRPALLYDLGIGGKYFQLCVRATEPEALAALGNAEGQRLLESPDLMRALIASSPARVFVSKLARIEVNQPIAQAGQRSPEGPHTHLLPGLLRDTGSVKLAARPGWIAQAVAYPAHPLRTRYGASKAFSLDEYSEFQAWLTACGDPGHVLVKQLVVNAVRGGVNPGDFPADAARLDSIRIALRQLAALDGDSQHLRRWRTVFDSDRNATDLAGESR